jgi:hypothetical protein
MAARRSTGRVHYSFDDANRLEVRDRLRPLRIVEGRLAVDVRNRLVYHAEERTHLEDGPRSWTFEGDWSLTPDHRAALTLRERTGGGAQRLYLNGALTRATADSLVVTLARDARGSGGTSSGEITLAGRWHADARNRLVFLVRKANGSEDRLTFQGGWELDERQQLTYRYLRRAPGGRTDAHTLVFDGAWDVPGAGRLVYRFAGSTTSAFEFRASLRTASLSAAEGRLVYDVGIGLSRGVRRRRVSLFGTWKLSRDLSVSFEVPYARGRVQAIRFEAAASMSRRDRLAFELAAAQGERLGLTVTFTRKLVPDASLFLRLKHDAEERSALGGVHVRF